MTTKNRENKRAIRQRRIRAKVSGTESIPRLAVFRSNSYIYVQLINDIDGKTIASASDLKMDGKENKTDKAKKVGEEIAKLAKEKKIKEVVFDRGGFIYTGRVRALAETARENGLKF